ncbi:MAG: phage tail tape measure protein [Lachnospiraceae bacterium]|nr:phage tail tape measure protein [Lachnospiraceae bacterium]
MVKNASEAQQKYGNTTEKLKKILEEAKEGTGKLTEEQKKAAEAVDVHVNSTDELRRAIEKSEAQYEAAGRAIQKYNTEANNTEAGLFKLSGELAETDKELDRVTAESEKSARGLLGIGNAARTTGGDVADLGKVIDATVASQAIISGIKALANGIKEIASAAVGTGEEFEASMSQVAATMGITSDAIRNGSNDYKTLEAAAKKCGETTKYSASEAAEALNYLALAGYDAAKSAETLPKVLDLAAAGGMDLATASDMVTDAMAALGMETSDLDQYIDEMAKTAQKPEFSKVILAVVALATIAIVVASFVLMFKTMDLTPLAYIVPGIFAELASATGFYYWKARAENMIKLKALMGEQQLTMTEEFQDFPQNNGGAKG